MGKPEIMLPYHDVNRHPTLSTGFTTVNLSTVFRFSWRGSKGPQPMQSRAI